MADGVENPEKTEPSTPGVGARLLQALTGSAPEKKVNAIPPNILEALKQNNTALNLLVGKLDKFVTNQEEKDKDTGEEAKQALKTEKPKSFILADVDDKALDKVKKLFEDLGLGEKSAKAATNVTNIKKGPDKESLSKMLGNSLMAALPLAAVLAGVAGSLALAIGSWFNNGPFKGLMKEAGLRGSQIFLKLVKPAFNILEKLAPTFAKGIMKAFSGVSGLFKSGAGKIALQFTKLFPTLAKFLGPILKKLPVIGTIINIGSAISRFMAGDIIGGLIDLGSAVAVLIPGVGTAISIGLGFLNAARDLTGETEKSKAGEGKADKSIISTMVIGFGKFAAKLLPKLKFIPVLGGLFSLYEAYNYFKKGNILQGILGLVSGIASFIPGAGTIVSLIAGGVNILLDLFGSKEEKPQEGEKKEAAPPGIMKKAWDWIKEKATKAFSWYFGKIGRGWDAIKKGDVIRGLVTWASFIPALMWVEPVYNWLMGTPETIKEDGKKEPAQPGMLSKAWAWIKEKATKVFSWYFGKIGRGWDAIKKGDVIRGLYTWASLIPALSWLEPVYNWLMGTPETIKEDGKKEPAQPGMLSKAWTWIKEKVKTKLLFPALVKIATGWRELQKGNVLKGLYTWATLIPGFSWLGGIVSWLLDDGVEKPKEENVKADEKLNANTIYETISKGVKEKFKTILENLKKLRFVPNSIVEKIAGFLGIDLNSKAESAKAAPAISAAPKTPTTVAPATIPTGALPTVTASPVTPSTSWTAAPMPKEPVAQVPVQSPTDSAKLTQTETDKNKKAIDLSTNPAQKLEDKKNASYTDKAIDPSATQTIDSEKPASSTDTQIQNKTDNNAAYPSVMRNTKADIPLQPNTEPRVPLQSEAAVADSSGFNITKKLDELIAAVQTLRPAARSNNNAASINNTTGGSSITNVFNNGTERDIPYTERTKYRNQLIYARTLL